MKKPLFALVALAIPAALLASTDPVADTRSIMAGTVTTVRVKNEYLSGARDGTTAFRGALTAYKAVRAAEVPPVVVPPPPPPAQPVIGPVGERGFNTAPGLPDIASTFDPTTLLVPAWGSGGIPSSMAPDVVGAFRFMCAAGPVRWVDWIVNKGTKSDHLHQFFGLNDFDENTTYESQRAGGNSSCEGNPAMPGKSVNPSGYWMPAMLDGKGNVVRPDFVSIYYKRRPISDPKCSLTSGDPKAEGDCVPLPNGLRFVFGFDMVTHKAATGAHRFQCDGPSAIATTSFSTITEVIPLCPTAPTPIKQWDGTIKQTYNRILATIGAPSCWDGKNLDTPNHRDHVAYGSFGDWGYFRCPSSHPKVIPSFQMGAGFRVDENLGTWRLASDLSHPSLPAGSTFHSDFAKGWDSKIEAMWMDNCINKLLNCAGGDLGNGKQVWGMWGTSWEASPRLVPIPN